MPEIGAGNLCEVQSYINSIVLLFDLLPPRIMKINDRVGQRLQIEMVS